MSASVVGLRDMIFGDQITYEEHSLKVIGLRGRRVTRIEVRRL